MNTWYDVIQFLMWHLKPKLSILIHIEKNTFYLTAI